MRKPKYPLSRCIRDIAAETRFRGGRSLKKRLLTLFFRQDFHLLALYRLGRCVHAAGMVNAGKIFVFLQPRLCACQISPMAILEVGVKFPHPIGIVIGEGSQIEQGLQLFQHVTLGSKRTGKESGDPMGYPTIEANAKLYPQSMAIGKVTIGRNAIIGAQSLVLSDVAAGTIAAGSPARMVSDKTHTPPSL